MDARKPRPCRRPFALTITSEPVLGWRLRSIGARAQGAQGECWLRVVSQEPQWAQGNTWTGTVDAAAITGLHKPQVLEVFEWEQVWVQRAEVMTIMPGRPCSATDVLRSDLALPDEWWSDLRRSLDRLAATPTERVNADQEKVSQRIRERFGPTVDTAVTRWETVHGDLRWSNLVQPRFGILDWELWGRGPAATDAATLYCYSLLVPEMAERVHAAFRDQLDSRWGRVAQLYVTARLLRRIDGGDYPDLGPRLHEHARRLLG